MSYLKDPAARAAWVYGQPMAPCPKCGSYSMRPQMPIKMGLSGDETLPQLLGKWARATKAGVTLLEGPCYYICWDCKHRGPAVDCTGRTSEDCRQDRALNAEMKRLWNSQGSNLEAEHPSMQPFKCPVCGSRYFGPMFEKQKHVGRYCKGWPSGHDRSYIPCKGRHEERFETPNA